MDHSIAHSYVYGRVKQRNKGNIVNRKKILEILRFIIRIPGPHQLDFFNELEESGFFKKLSRDKYEILIRNVELKEEGESTINEIKRIMEFIMKLKEPFKQNLLDAMKKEGHISVEDKIYKILKKKSKQPKDFYGTPLWG